MRTITDPGAGLPRDEAREARKAAWADPTDPIEAERERAERICAGMEDELNDPSLDPAKKQRLQHILDHFKEVRAGRGKGDTLRKPPNR